MMLKCIGGPQDQVYCEVRDDLKLRDHWKIPRGPRFVDVQSCDPLVTTRIDHYILDIIRTDKLEIKFLRYEKLTLETILIQVFE